MLYDDQDHLREKSEDEGLDIGRSAFRRDYGRLLHCPAFRRLQGKTQLFPGHESDFFRNRLTHSLEVAQVAKGIALKFNKTCPEFTTSPIDLDLVEFAGLAHDLGHPPFGHNGEQALDDCMKEFGGFEGNAQTLRILSRVEKKALKESPDDPSPFDGCGISLQGVDRRLGLNLTYRTLASILKYDTPIPLQGGDRTIPQKGYYDSERDLVANIKRHVGSPEGNDQKFKTIECRIMDIADDIAYSTYDLEDTMKAGFTHPLALLSRLTSVNTDLIGRLREKVAKEIKDVTCEEVLDALNTRLNLTPDVSDPRLAYITSKLIADNGAMRSRFSSAMVNDFIAAVSVTPRRGKGIRFSEISVSREAGVEIEALKHLNYLLTIMSPRLKVVEYRGYEVVKTIFETLNSVKGELLLPDDVREMYGRLSETNLKKRMICDFVAGMTDRYAVEFYGRLRETGTSLFKPI